MMKTRSFRQRSEPAWKSTTQRRATRLPVNGVPITQVLMKTIRRREIAREMHLHGMQRTCLPVVRAHGADRRRVTTVPVHPRRARHLLAHVPDLRCHRQNLRQLRTSWMRRPENRPFCTRWLHRYLTVTWRKYLAMKSSAKAVCPRRCVRLHSSSAPCTPMMTTNSCKPSLLLAWARRITCRSGSWMAQGVRCAGNLKYKRRRRRLCQKM